MIIFITTIQTVFINHIIVIQIIGLSSATKVGIIGSRILVWFIEYIGSTADLGPVANACAFKVCINHETDCTCDTLAGFNAGNWRIQRSNTAVVCPRAIR